MFIPMNWWLKSRLWMLHHPLEFPDESNSHLVMWTLCNPMGSIINGILQARILEWVAIPFSRWSSQPGGQTQVSHIVGRFFTSWATREAHKYWRVYPILSPVDLPDPGIELGSPALQADSLPTELSRKPRVSWWSFVIPSSHLSLASPSLSNCWFPFCHYRFICIFLWQSFSTSKPFVNLAFSLTGCSLTDMKIFI